MAMHGRANESSPLLEGEADPPREWGDADCRRGRVLLPDTRDKSRRPPSGAVARAAFHPRNRRLGAGIVVLAVALAALVAIFSAAKGQVAPRNATPLQMKEASVGEASSPAASAEAASASDRLVGNINAGKGDEAKGAGATGGQQKTDTDTDAVSPDKSSASTKPNVFFIMIDDMGYGDIGYQSIDLQGTTPNLDKLAEGGVKIKEYYSMFVCTPARASLMTGRYVVRYGLQYNIIDTGEPWGLPLTEKIFPQYMKDAGYETHMVGKWHLGSYDHGYVPSNRGFDTYLGFLEGMEMYWTHQSLDASLDGRKFFDFGFGNSTGYYDIIAREAPDYPLDASDEDDDTILSPTSQSESHSGSGPMFKGVYSTQVFQDRAVEILKEKTPFDEEPLYMYLSHQAVHRPLGLPPEGSFSHEELAILEAIEFNSDDSGHLRKRFAKVLMYLDHTIGELVDYLETEGWMENSIIVVASDNGGCLNNGGSNYPLRGTKFTYFEGGNKVPAFVYSKSHIPEERWGTEYDGIMHVTDWLPTIASAAGITLDGGAGSLDGINHWDYIVSAEAAAKDDTPRQEMMYNFDPYVFGVDDDGSIGAPDFELPQGAFRSGKYKYIANEWCSGWYTFNRHTQAVDDLTDADSVCDGEPCESCGYCTGFTYQDYLFDLEADPREENNIIDEFPEIALSMRDRWMETALSEFANSGYEAVDTRSYDVWLKYNWWIVPWWDQVEKPPLEQDQL